MRFYDLERFVQMYLQEFPTMSREEAEQHALELRHLQDRLDRNWTNSQSRFRAWCSLCGHNPEQPYELEPDS